MQVLALGLMGSPWLCTVGSSPFFFHYLPACTPASSGGRRFRTTSIWG